MKNSSSLLKLISCNLILRYHCLASISTSPDISLRLLQYRFARLYLNLVNPGVMRLTNRLINVLGCQTLV